MCIRDRLCSYWKPAAKLFLTKLFRINRCLYIVEHYSLVYVWLVFYFIKINLLFCLNEIDFYYTFKLGDNFYEFLQLRTTNENCNVLILLLFQELYCACQEMFSVPRHAPGLKTVMEEIYCIHFKRKQLDTKAKNVHRLLGRKSKLSFEQWKYNYTKQR